MKRKLLSTLLVCLSFPVISYAGWQMATPQQSNSMQPFFQGGMNRPDYKGSLPGIDQNSAKQGYQAQAQSYQQAKQGNRQFSSALYNTQEDYVATVKGSLKENLEHIMSKYHWKVLWKSPNDYHFDGHVKSNSLPGLVGSLVTPFPLQAIFYTDNHIMTIIPRKTK